MYIGQRQDLIVSYATMALEIIAATKPIISALELGMGTYR